MARIFYYEWRKNNHTSGLIIGFLTKKEARQHQLENFPHDSEEEDICSFKIGELEEFYTGE